MPLLYITWVRLVLTNVYNIFVPLDSSCEPNTLMVTDEYIIQTAGEAFSCLLGAEVKTNEVPFGLFLFHPGKGSSSYSFCSNPPGAFANPAAMEPMEIGCRLHLVLSLSWLESTSCSSTSLLLPVQPDKRPLVGRHQATWAGFPCTDWYSGHQRTSHQLLWELECGRNTIWPHPQASVVCSVSLIFIRQESGRYETRQKGSSCFRETVSQYKEAIHWQPAPGVVVAGGCHSSYQGKRLQDKCFGFALRWLCI